MSAHLVNLALAATAGLGPIFGPIRGALYGPIAMLWIVIGCIFAGAVHDYFSGTLSVRQNGTSVSNIVGRSWWSMSTILTGGHDRDFDLVRIGINI